MNKLFLYFSIVIAALVMVSCGSNAEDKLIGTWKVKKVETDFDETKVTPEMLTQVVEMQKQTYFRILNDSAMVIITNKNTHEAKWTLNQSDQSITYFFVGMETLPNQLGKVEGDAIVSKSKSALGMMTIIYEKE